MSEENRSNNDTPRRLLPRGSSRGEKVAIPIWPGRAPISPPDTGGDEQRALAGVAVHDGDRVLGEDVVTAEHVADGEVALGVLHLGCVQGLVDLQPAAGEGREIPDHALESLSRANALGSDQRVRGDRAGVDHRSERAS